MSEVFPFEGRLPEAAGAAVDIVRTLAEAGHQALLAGGCVRDLLLGHPPQDYDVATSAPPERVCELFRTTRKVGVQFGVVLVKRRRRWVEVATFRTDGPYLDGRRPVEVQLSDARHDALRRDFTVNGMFLDPLAQQIVDYVDGRADLAARLIRAIGEPRARFEEDYLRLLRAVRFAARLDFPIEPVTLAAIQEHAPTLAQVAAERVREELAKMLAHPARQQAWALLRECGLVPYLWPGAGWDADEAREIDAQLGRLPADAPFEVALALLLENFPPGEIERVARELTLSNDEREVTAWLVVHRHDLDDPHAPSLAELKRLMSQRAFGSLRMIARARHLALPAGPQYQTALDERIQSIAPEAVSPSPFVTGEDLLARGVPPGPVYKEVLDTLYTQQLDEQIASREQALQTLEVLLRGGAAAEGGN